MYIPSAAACKAVSHACSGISSTCRRGRELDETQGKQSSSRAEHRDGGSILYRRVCVHLHHITVYLHLSANLDGQLLFPSGCCQITTCWASSCSSLRQLGCSGSVRRGLSFIFSCSVIAFLQNKTSPPCSKRSRGIPFFWAAAGWILHAGVCSSFSGT